MQTDDHSSYISTQSAPASAGDCMRLCDDEFWAANPSAADVQAEIDKGARLDGVCHLDSTSLHLAAHFSTAEVIVLLIKAGSDVNALEPHFGYAPLHTALTKSTDNLKALIDAGADVNFRAKAYRFEKKHTGLTALHGEAAIGTVETISVLLKAGADIDITDNTLQSTPLHVAANESNIETVRFLLAKVFYSYGFYKHR